MTVTVAMGLRTVLQGGVFIIVASNLGITDYGAYVAVLALSVALGNLSGLGVNTVMLRHVASNPSDFSTEWGKTLASIGLTLPPLIITLLSVGFFLLPQEISTAVILMVGVSELCFSPLAIAGLSAAQAHNDTINTARFIIVPAIPRFIASTLLLIPEASTEITDPLLFWAILHSAASSISAGYILWTAHHVFGKPSLPSQLTCVFSAIRSGTLFWGANVIGKVYSDTDKIMLARLASLTDAGAYSAAHRIIEFALIPINSLVIASTSDFFRAGKNSGGALAIARSVITIPLAFCLAIAPIIYISADLIPALIGESYAAAILPLKLLALLPAISLPRLLLQAVLAAEYMAKQVLAALGCGTLIVITLNFLLIPSLGWQAPIIATYSAEIIMTALMGFIYFKRRNVFKTS